MGEQKNTAPAGPRPGGSELTAALSVALSCVALGTTPFAAKLLYTQGLDPTSVLFWRYGIACAVLVPIAFLLGGSLAKHWRHGRWLLLNALCFGAPQAFCYYKALETVPTSITVLLFYCYPVLTLVIERFMLGLEVRSRTVAVIGVILTGLALIAGTELVRADIPLHGLAYAAAVPVIYAIYILISYRVLGGVPALAGAVYAYGGMLLALAAFALAMGVKVPVGWPAWGALVYFATFAGALTALTFAYALPRLRPSGYAVIVSLEPVTVLAIGVLVLGEHLSTLELVGAALVVGGVVIERLIRVAPKK